MQTRVALSFAVFGLVLAFQNCAQKGALTADATGDAHEQVIGTTSSYTKVVYDRRLESVNAPDGGQPRIELDLSAGEVQIRDAAGTRVCALDEARLGSLRALLAQSHVCKPAPPASGSVQCMAIGLADIELSSASGESVQLRPPVCSQGTFLCDGNDKILRELLVDLASNSPCN